VLSFYLDEALVHREASSVSYKLEAFALAKGFNAPLEEYLETHLYHRHDGQSPNPQQRELPDCIHQAHKYSTHHVQEGTGGSTEKGIKGFVKQH